MNLLIGTIFLVLGVITALETTAPGVILTGIGLLVILAGGSDKPSPRTPVRDERQRIMREIQAEQDAKADAWAASADWWEPAPPAPQPQARPTGWKPQVITPEQAAAYAKARAEFYGPAIQTVRRTKVTYGDPIYPEQ